LLAPHGRAVCATLVGVSRLDPLVLGEDAGRNDEIAYRAPVLLRLAPADARKQASPTPIAEPRSTDRWTCRSTKSE
jgi:hypothetical protein